MAYTTPRTWVAGEYPTAAQMNANVRDNLNAAFPLGVDAWTDYTPTVTQSGAVTKTVNWSKYQRVGRTITWQFRLTMTGAGTGGNRVSLTLPVTAAASASVGMGVATIYDASATAKYVCMATWLTTTTIAFEHDTSTSDAWGVTPNVALASGDVIWGTVTFEAAN